VVVDSLRELPQDLTPTSAAAGEKFSENGDFVDVVVSVVPLRKFLIFISYNEEE